MQGLFDLPASVKPHCADGNEAYAKCGQCAHIQRWECNSKFFYYCGAQKSNRTANGFLKVKRKNDACELFEKR
jgi:hypothetical protein